MYFVCRRAAREPCRKRRVPGAFRPRRRGRENRQRFEDRGRFPVLTNEDKEPSPVFIGAALSYNANLAFDEEKDDVYALGGVGVGGGGIGFSPIGLSIGFFNVESVQSLKSYSYPFSISIAYFGFQFVIINEEDGSTSYGYVFNLSPFPSRLSVDAQVVYETPPSVFNTPDYRYWEVIM